MSLEETKSSEALKLLGQSRPPFCPTTATTGPSCPGGLQALGGGCQGNRALVCCWHASIRLTSKTLYFLSCEASVNRALKASGFLSSDKGELSTAEKFTPQGVTVICCLIYGLPNRKSSYFLFLSASYLSSSYNCSRSQRTRRSRKTRWQSFQSKLSLAQPPPTEQIWTLAVDPRWRLWASARWLLFSGVSDGQRQPVSHCARLFCVI